MSNNSNPVQILDNTIRPGDLVAVTRPCPLCKGGDSIGQIFQVVQIVVGCIKCDISHLYRDNATVVVAPNGDAFQLEELTKIHPPGIEDSTADVIPTKEHLHV